MNVALISDIHSNAHALRAVLDSALNKDVSKILCCGDYIGYYYEPKKVISLLNEWEWEGVSGNHEIMLRNWLYGIKRKEIQKKYGSSISIAAKQLSQTEAKYIYDRPKLINIGIDNYKVLICHGSPWDRDMYIYPDAEKEIVDKMFNYESDFDMLVYGHTHYPVIWERGNKKIVNPGSVGQARNRKSGAAWALWNTINNDVEFFRESYDVYPVVQMCKKFDPQIKYLANVLERK